MGDSNTYRDSPIAWFAALERARKIEDFELAAEAQQQLRRLGVIVTYPKQQEAEKQRLSNACKIIGDYAKEP
jgi:hypothetical protein